MKDCQATRPGRLSGAAVGDLKPEDIQKDPEGFAKRLQEAMKPEKLVKKGSIRVSGKSFDLYLPESTEPYAVENKGESDSHHENSSTLLSIDGNGDGKLTGDEGWFASLPIRIADSMWEVVAIAADGSRIELKPSRKPLAGVVVGRKCPPFSFRTEEGKPVTLDSYRGKALLIDIWSVT